MEQVQHGEEAGIESEARVWSLHHQVRSPLMASVETPVIKQRRLMNQIYHIT